jgi:methylmalonyl-CoA/ethylmalonyl-CoA epimerase
MNLRKIEHLGIAVKDLEASKKLFAALLGAACYKEEEVASEHVKTAFFHTGESKVELLQATSPDSAIARFIDKKGEGIHHVAFDVADIYSEIDRLKAAGFVFINETPKAGADNKLIVFLHPKSTNGLLVELCQERK